MRSGLNLHPRRGGRWLWMGAGLLLSAGGWGPGVDAASAWKPERNVEIIVPTSPGSAQDHLARLIQRIWHERKLLDVSSTISNRAGVVGIDYLAKQAGSGHHLYIGSAVVLTNHLLGKSPVPYTELTPVSQLFSEYIACVVKADSPYKTAGDLLEQLKKNPESISIAFATSRGNTNHVAIAFAAKSAGIDPRRLKVVLFKSGGEATTALLGGHVDVVSTAAGTVVDHLAAGRLRALAVSSPRRLGDAYATVPTWREVGAESVASNWRNIFGPKGMSPEQLQFWEQVLARVVESDEWKQSLETRLQVDTYMNSRDSKAFLDKEHESLKNILTEIGLIK